MNYIFQIRYTRIYKWFLEVPTIRISCFEHESDAANPIQPFCFRLSNEEASMKKIIGGVFLLISALLFTSCPVGPSDINVIGVILNESSISVSIGHTKQLTPQIFPIDA